MLEELKYKVWTAAGEMQKAGLVRLGIGSLSAIDREQGLIVITPDDIDFTELRPEQLITADLGGKVIEGDSAPSADIPVHCRLYQRLAFAGGIVGSSSAAASSFAVACKPIPVFSAIHAGIFDEEIPATRPMTKAEIENGLEQAKAAVIDEALTAHAAEKRGAVLLSSFGPYAWARSISDAVKQAAALEEIAQLSLSALALTPGLAPISETLQKHIIQQAGPKFAR